MNLFNMREVLYLIKLVQTHSMRWMLIRSAYNGFIWYSLDLKDMQTIKYIILHVAYVSRNGII